MDEDAHSGEAPVCGDRRVPGLVVRCDVDVEAMRAYDCTPTVL